MRHWIVAIFFLVIITSCTTTQEMVPAVNHANTTEETRALEKDQGIITETLSFSSNGSESKIVRNKLTKQAYAESITTLSDDEEYIKIADTTYASAPFSINLICSYLGLYFYDTNKLKKYLDNANLHLNITNSGNSEDIAEFLKNYSLEYSHVEFIDAESKELIAECKVNGPEWENIEFKKYRTYEQSLFNIQIGEQPKFNNEVGNNSETGTILAQDQILTEESNKCKEPYFCSSTCDGDHISGKKDCPSGEICCFA